MNSYYYVINLGIGYIIKKFQDVQEARAYAEKCNRNNHCSDFIVCVNYGGCMNEI